MLPRYCNCLYAVPFLIGCMAPFYNELIHKAYTASKNILHNMSHYHSTNVQLKYWQCIEIDRRNVDKP